MLMTLVSISAAQDNSYAEQRMRANQKDKESLAEAIKDSLAAEELYLKVNTGDTDSILKAAETGDKSLIPYFKLLADNKSARSHPDSASFYAHIALVKFNDEVAFNEINEELKDSNPFVQDGAIKKLAVAGTKKAFQKLYELLDDTETRKPNPLLAEDVVYAPNNAVVAMFELAEVVDNPPIQKNTVPSVKDIPLWKDWFGKNRHLIE